MKAVPNGVELQSGNANTPRCVREVGWARDDLTLTARRQWRWRREFQRTVAVTFLTHRCPLSEYLHAAEICNRQKALTF